ncbi:hypothetical protein PLEOSDRAFT_171709 [Pleurotus ostreatus PC15]|uniref:Uncharacterized protein n=1 Tax=Pleurotus ostreatus (strain PC15) TaxID=1137138 RepID=A0A067N2Q6_PLEO1|nr:hypothetical protein PLEOSDRAFT_171709 [Pleurotus ostreatus PC15]
MVHTEYEMTLYRQRRAAGIIAQCASPRSIPNARTAKCGGLLVDHIVAEAGTSEAWASEHSDGISTLERALRQRQELQNPNSVDWFEYVHAPTSTAATSMTPREPFEIRVALSNDQGVSKDAYSSTYRDNEHPELFMIPPQSSTYGVSHYHAVKNPTRGYILQPHACALSRSPHLNQHFLQVISSWSRQSCAVYTIDLRVGQAYDDPECAIGWILCFTIHQLDHRLGEDASYAKRF